MASSLRSSGARSELGEIVLFLAGDVVTARGIDQTLPHPSDPTLFEPYVRDARAYVEIAEAAGAHIPRKASFSQAWGDALEIWARIRPDIRIVNLETSITRSDDHWPGKDVNYRMSPDNIQCLVESGAVDLVHGHSSHHVKAIEVHRGKLILYGCGYFLDDYEGITGFESYRGDLGLMYFARLTADSGELTALRLVPTQIKDFRVNRASAEGCVWLERTLEREGGPLGTSVLPGEDGTLMLRWRE